ncbi:MAG TPA: AAA family ATPase [Terracidiphilus sp.]|nr:ATPase AAA-2 domain protein [Candidatus Sulfopaludibacter sp. SbA4]HXR40015.1 AAA family ATPase [Terracidiphilus sp.]
MKEPNRPEERRRNRVKNPTPAIIKSEGTVDKPKNSQSKAKKPSADPIEDLTSVLSQKVVGQPTATKVIVPYIQMFQAGLAPEGRPVGVFLLLGPTGTGKTKTVEALAEVLHGTEKNVLKVDCGEFQMEHEVAKLIGAPPGYLGHRETQPMLTQQKLNAVTSEKCNLSLVLFDEIEKAAPSMTRLLLGVLDKGILRLGDNSTVNFEKSLVFLTSNLGAREMMREINPDFGFQSVKGVERSDLTSKLQNIALVAVRKRFSPEFVNRIDCIITYQPLSAESLSAILDKQIADLQNHVNTRLANRSFTLEVPQDAREFLLKKGTSSEYGARELNRTIHRHLTQPLATLVATNQVSPGSRVGVDVAEDGEKLNIRTVESTTAPMPANPTVLLVDDNRDLLHFLERLMANDGWTLLTAESATDAKRLVQEHKPNAALLDYMLPDGNGVELGVEFLQAVPQMLVIVMTGTILPPEEEALCEEHNFPVLRKPFLASDVMNQIRSRLAPAGDAVRA